MELKSNGVYFAYLRKSREDRDAELRGEGETLLRHERIIEGLESYHKIKIAKWYREVVSGDTIASRPQMLAMLDDIEQTRPDGVLVVEIERLARGDTRDQGLILETFKYSATKIITPMKIYDPNDEFDEEYAEFGLFMSRREYKTINRRLQRGRHASFNEGKWTGNKAPYGYERIKIPNDKGFTLKVIPEQSEVVKLIFQLFVFGTSKSGGIPIGTSAICRALDDLHISAPVGNGWVPCTIRSILENPAYIGKVRSGQRKQQKQTLNGVVSISRPVNKEVEIRDGLHEPIIDTDLFLLAQTKRKKNYKKPFFTEIKNPLAGLIYCKECEKSMYRRPAGDRCPSDTICCNTHGCKTSSSYYYLIEDRLIQALNQWLSDYKIRVSPNTIDDSEKQISFLLSRFDSVSSELVSTQKQLHKAMDLLEKEIYSVEMFQSRASELNEKIAINKREIAMLDQQIKQLQLEASRQEDVIPKFEYVLSHYHEVKSGAEKNALLKQILERVEYSKAKKGNRFTGGMDAFQLEIYPRL